MTKGAFYSKKRTVEWQMNHAPLDACGKGTPCKMADFSTDSDGKQGENQQSDAPSTQIKHTTVKVSACEWARMNLFVMWHYLALCSVPHLQEESLLLESHDTHTHAEKHQSLSFNRKLMPSLLLKDLDLWQVHEHILNQTGQMKLEGSSWKPCTGSCQFALMAPNAITKAHAKQLLWISMICKGYK